MAVFTVFAFGTGEKSTMKKKNIISQFSEACTSDHTIIEGPGTLGWEVSVNVKKKSKEIIAWLVKQDDIENNINLTGFSRGSVTCMRIANQLKKYEHYLEKQKEHLNPDAKKLLAQLKALNVHIFAVDPVAGMRDKSHMDGKVIPDNVKSFVAILQLDEMRRDFKPQDLTRIIVDSPETTKISLLPMYGNHSNLTKIRDKSMQSGPKVAWYALNEFLTQHGTTFQDDKIPQIVTSDMKFANLSENPGPKEILKLFTTNHQERTAYLEMGQASKLTDGIPIARKMRSMNKHVEFYVKNSDFFTNQLERELFKISYPKTFNYLFENNQFDLRFPESSGCEKQDVKAELLLLKHENPALFKRLHTLGVSDSEQSINLGKPAGVYCLEPCASIEQMFPAMMPETIKAHILEMNKLANLEKSIYRLTFRYEREKSDLSPFSSRSQACYAQGIRNQVKNIIDNEPGDRNTKYLRVLDSVEEHYKKLIQSRTESALTDMLEEFLANNGRHYQILETSLPRVFLANFIHLNLSLLKETIRFVGSLGYIGGGILGVIGNALQDFGRRCNELLGPLGYNPLKYLASAIGYTFEGIGFALKNSFGLRPLTNFIISSIQNIRNELVIAIGATQIIKLNASTAGLFASTKSTDENPEKLPPPGTLPSRN